MPAAARTTGALTDAMSTISSARGGVARLSRSSSASVPSKCAASTTILLASYTASRGAISSIAPQRNARIELATAVAAVLVAIWLGITAVEWAVLVLTIAFVLGLEWINTALELAVSLASPERHPSAKAAKDVAAASVLLAAAVSVFVGLLLFLPLALHVVDTVAQAFLTHFQFIGDLEVVCTLR